MMEGALTFKFAADTVVMIGLAYTSPTSATALTYSIYGNNGVARIFELGTERVLSPEVSYTARDEFSIERDGSSVVYQKNARPLRTAAIGPSPLASSFTVYVWSPMDGGVPLVRDAKMTGAQ